MDTQTPGLILALYDIGKKDSDLAANVAECLTKSFGINVIGGPVQTVAEIRQIIAADTEKNIKGIGLSVVLLDSNEAGKEVFAAEIVEEIIAIRADITIMVFRDAAGLVRVDPTLENTGKTFAPLRMGTDDILYSAAPGEFARSFKEYLQRLASTTNEGPGQEDLPPES